MSREETEHRAGPAHLWAVMGTRDGAGDRDKRDARMMERKKQHFSVP